MLTTRIAHILSLGLAYPCQILAVTFTNKAAREMKQRIGLLVGEAVEGMPWLGTFHSIGVKLLRRHAELAGLRSDFTILDTDDQVRLISQIIQAEGLDDKRWPPRVFAQMIDGWKNKGLDPAAIPEGDARAFANGKGRELYPAYQDRLKTLNACDFGDLLLHPIRLFRANPDVLKEYHRRFRYILVDEYQDTNTAQYMWLRLLAQRPEANALPPAEGRARDRAPGDVSPALAEASPKGGAAVSEYGRRPQARPGVRALSQVRGPRGGPAPAQAAGTARQRKQSQHLLRRRRRSVDLWLARRRGRQHPALREGFSGRHRHPARAQLPLDRPYPRHRLASHRPQ